MNIDTFFKGYRQLFGPFQQEQRDALYIILKCIENDSYKLELEQYAYILATIHHETNKTYRPIKEKLQVIATTAHQKRIKDLQSRYAPSGFYGRGYVQITWQQNYRALGEKLKKHYSDYIDLPDDWLEKNPDQALKPPVAWHIISLGMRLGLFTGVCLSKYISQKTGEKDYVSARKIVNGTDKADEIANVAFRFERLLKSC